MTIGKGSLVFGAIGGALLIGACSAAPGEQTGESRDAVKCVTDPTTGEVFCATPPPPPIDACLPDSTPLPSPSPLAALSHCTNATRIVTLPASPSAIASSPWVWTCDAPAAGVVVPYKMWPDSRSHFGTTTFPTFGVVFGTDSARPSCGRGVDSANLCEASALLSTCYPQPPAGRILVMTFQADPCQNGIDNCGGSPSACHGLCKTPH